MNSRLRYWAIAIAASCLGASAGCGGAASEAVPQATRETAVALKLAGVQYADFLVSHNGIPPKDLAQFREFVESRLADLQNYNVKSADDLLHSRRDGKPLTLICGKPIVDTDQSGMLWAAYEQTGVDGKRMASNVRGGVVELTPEEFTRRLPGAQ